MSFINKFGPGGKSVVDQTPEDRSKASVIVSVIIISAAVIFYFFIGNVNIDFLDYSFSVKCILGGSVNVAFNEVESVEYVDSFDYGGRLSGSETNRLMAGTFENTAFGKFKFLAYKSCDEYIIVHYGDDEVVVFNQKTPELTEQCYEELLAVLKL